MSKFTRTEFDVTMAPAEGETEPTTHRVTVILADQLRGELEGKRHGVDIKDAIHTTALWGWSAMVREGHTSLSFREFTAACWEVEQVKDREPTTVDPTTPGS